VHLVGLSHVSILPIKVIQLCQLLKLIQDLFLIRKAFTNYCNATYQVFFGNFNEQKLWQFISTSNTTILTQPHYKLLALFLEITKYLSLRKYECYPLWKQKQEPSLSWCVQQFIWTQKNHRYQSPSLSEEHTVSSN